MLYLHVNGVLTFDFRFFSHLNLSFYVFINDAVFFVSSFSTLENRVLLL